MMLLGLFTHVQAQSTPNAGSAGTYIQRSEAPAQAPHVLELFTSAGCPQCPRADANFNQLAGRQDVIALGCHVTYFDSRRKPDPYAQVFCDARQSIYKLSLNTGKIFTPMMVLNGRQYVTGMQKEDLEKALNKQSSSSKVQPVGLSFEGAYLNIALPQLSAAPETEVWLIEYKPLGVQNYHNAVINITKLMNWQGQAAQLAFPVQPENAYAVLAQSYKQGIFAAGKITPQVSDPR